VNFPVPRTIDWLLRNGGFEIADLRILLCLESSSVQDEPDAEFLDDFTTLDECDAPEYARIDLASLALTYQAATLRTELDTANPDWGVLNPGASGRKIRGAMTFLQLGAGTPATNRPFEWIDTMAPGGPIFPYQMTGSVFRIVVPTAGWTHLISKGASIET
jgi:hypothetical protein